MIPLPSNVPGIPWRHAKVDKKKVERFEELEKTIEELKDEVEHWKKIALSRSG